MKREPLEEPHIILFSFGKGLPTPTKDMPGGKTLSSCIRNHWPIPEGGYYKLVKVPDPDGIDIPEDSD